MFKKLVSNLPFNPSLINQVSFYMRRMRKESAIRRVGLVFIILTMMVQFFAVLVPPQASLQASPGNDIISGGFESKDQAILHCLNSAIDFSTILAYYGITCDDLGASQEVSLPPRGYGDNLFSMGRINYGTRGTTPIYIPNANNGQAVYLRYLSGVSKNPNAPFRALQGRTKYGQTFFILFDCGNLVFIGLPTPQPPCPYKPGYYAADAECFEPCPVPGKQNIPKNSPQCFNPCPIPGKSQYPANSPQCFNPCKVPGKGDLPANSPLCFPPCPYNKTIPDSSPSCKPCEESQTKDDKSSCIEVGKSARNITTGLADANGSTVKASDVIEYKLTVTNKGKAKISRYVVSENISDVLDYADVVDLSGGTLDKSNILSWPPQDLAPKSTITKTFTVRIKNPIPATPTSTSDPGHFDSKMTNVFGNTVTILLPQPPSKRIETVTTTLPSTGPGTSLLIGFSVTVVVAYFFARSRLFATELDIIRHDYVSAGGV